MHQRKSIKDEIDQKGDNFDDDLYSSVNEEQGNDDEPVPTRDQASKDQRMLRVASTDAIHVMSVNSVSPRIQRPEAN